MTAASVRLFRPAHRVCIGLLVFAITLLAQACVDADAPATSSDRVAERPAAVPAEARYVGGADGGVYVVVERTSGSAPAAYQGEIYHANGELWYEGGFVLVPAESEPIDPDAKGIFTGWDGDTLYLNDGRYLRARDAPD